MDRNQIYVLPDPKPKKYKELPKEPIVFTYGKHFCNFDVCEEKMPSLWQETARKIKMSEGTDVKLPFGFNLLQLEGQKVVDCNNTLFVVRVKRTIISLGGWHQTWVSSKNEKLSQIDKEKYG